MHQDIYIYIYIYIIILIVQKSSDGKRPQANGKRQNKTPSCAGRARRFGCTSIQPTDFITFMLGRRSGDWTHVGPDAHVGSELAHVGPDAHVAGKTGKSQVLGPPYRAGKDAVFILASTDFTMVRYIATPHWRQPLESLKD